MDALIESKINDTYPIWLTPDRHEFHAARPGWEAERLTHCAETMKPGMCVWDCGAESGDFTALYHLWVGQEGTVIPIEPQPLYWPQIRAHWEGNELPPLKDYFGGFVGQLNQLLPPKDDGTMHQFETRGDGWPRCSVGRVIPDVGFRHLAQQTDHTPAARIDSLNVVMPTPDVIVMDIEGAEYPALLGAKAVLANVHPIMYVSIHQQTMWDWYDATLDMLLEFMRSVGYTGVKLGEGSEEYWVFT